MGQTKAGKRKCLLALLAMKVLNYSRFSPVWLLRCIYIFVRKKIKEGVGDISYLEATWAVKTLSTVTTFVFHRASATVIFWSLLRVKDTLRV